MSGIENADVEQRHHECLQITRMGGSLKTPKREKGRAEQYKSAPCRLWFGCRRQTVAHASERTEN
jgi:hypothetical protein